MMRCLIASLVLLMPSLSVAQEVPDAAPSVAVDAEPLAEAIATYPQEDWARRPLLPPVDIVRFERAISNVFAPDLPPELAGTRAVVVIEDGTLVYERYAEGFGPETRFISWSLAKSVSHALVGLAAKKGLIDPYAPLGLAEWSAPGDQRAQISFMNLLNNTSGLQWRSFDIQDGRPIDETLVQFGKPYRDAAAFVRNHPLASAPGAVWNYNSGGFHLAMGEIQNRLTNAAAPKTRRAVMHDFMFTELYEPLGIKSAVADYDATGTYLGGTALHMTARDYARFGLLYLRGGKWGAAQLLPEGWVQTAHRTHGASGGPDYGAGFWLSTVTPAFEGGRAFMPNVDATTYHADGFNNQYIVIVPSKKLVIVRLGLTGYENDAKSRVGDFLQELVLSFPQKAAPPGF